MNTPEKWQFSSFRQRTEDAPGSLLGRHRKRGGDSPKASAQRSALCTGAQSGGIMQAVNRLRRYPSRVDSCFVDDERVLPQTGDFYGGWITSNIVGIFKGGPGTSHW
jgi:hypothetical protein